MIPIDLKTGKDLESLRIAEAVERQDDFSSVLLNASIDGVLTYDLEMRYTNWSPAMERISGFTRDQVIGRRSFEVFPFLEREGMLALFEATFRGETARTTLRSYIVPETGRAGYFEQQNFPLFDEFRNVIGGMAIVREMTAIVERHDALIRANRALEEREGELTKLLERIRGGRVDCGRDARVRAATKAKSVRSD